MSPLPFAQKLQPARHNGPPSYYSLETLSRIACKLNILLKNIQS